MFRFVASFRFRILHRQIKRYREVTSDNWNEYKALVIECLRMACKADTNCSDEMLYWNILASFRRYQNDLMGKMPVEYYSDLFVTLRELSRAHHPELWAMLDKIRDK